MVANFLIVRLMTYTTSLDNLAKTITTGVTLLFALIIIVLYPVRPGEGVEPFFLTGVLLLIYGIAYAFRPVSYILTSEQLIIHRPFTDVKIDRRQVKSVELLEDGTLKWSVRVFGVGGLFGYYGKFANRKLGSMTWYATRRNKAVLLLTMENNKIILTPDEPERFVLDYAAK
jgi:Bacterial PH domain